MRRKHSEHHFRFFVSPESISENLFISQEKELINQIKNVFRLGSGDIITVLDNSGLEYEVKINSISKEVIRGTVLGKNNSNKRIKKICLFIPIIKNNNFDLVLEKCTELGVGSFQPVIYSHSIIRGKEKMERWKKIIKEASEQCGRFVMPDIKEPLDFFEATKNIEGSACFVADEGCDFGIMNWEPKTKNSDIINVFVGPEGGFSVQEMEMMKNKHFNFFSLGENILRSETACILSVGFFSLLC